MIHNRSYNVYKKFNVIRTFFALCEQVNLTNANLIASPKNKTILIKSDTEILVFLEFFV